MFILNEGQDRALDLALHSEDDIFITGNAGTGKTVATIEIIRELRKAGRVVRAASYTGLAAQALGGITLARLLGLGIAKRESEIRNASAIYRIAGKNLRGVTDLVVDEVSMCSGDYLKLMSIVMEEVLGMPGVPFGGVRTIWCGDFLQLPPICGRNDKPFDTRWAFQCPEFQRAVPVVLSERLRQRNPWDLEVLDQIRVAEPGAEARQFVLDASSREIVGATELHPRNAKVDEINRLRLEALVGNARTYRTEFKPGSQKKSILSNIPIGEAVTLKVGAPVICRANCPDRGYFNGTQGVIVEMTSKFVRIQLPDGGIRRIIPHEWRVEIREGDYVVQTLTAKGMPLILGWATTIHKAQGMTLARIHADLSECWEPGHTFTALSRATDLSNVSLTGPRVRMRTDPEALAFTRSLTGI